MNEQLKTQSDNLVYVFDTATFLISNSKQSVNNNSFRSDL